MADDRQFDEADAAVTQAVSEFESMWGRWDTVAPSYIVESALLELATELSALTDDIKDVAGRIASSVDVPRRGCHCLTRMFPVVSSECSQISSSSIHWELQSLR